MSAANIINVLESMNKYTVCKFPTEQKEHMGQTSQHEVCESENIECKSYETANHNTRWVKECMCKFIPSSSYLAVFIIIMNPQE